MSKVSVIIPVYNVEPYLEKCLDSLINQTLKDIEIICINDCSTDNSLNILEQYKNKDERIKLINLKENKGAAIARNEGLKIAKGEYLGFVDPDDYVDLNFYEELYKKAKQDDADIVKAKRKTYGIDGDIAMTDLNENIIKSGNKFIFSYEWWSAIYKKDLIEKNNILFPIECRKAQDIVFLFRCVLNSNKLSLIDNVFYNYVRRENSLDMGEISLDKVKSNLTAIKLILNDLNKSDLYEKSPNLYSTVYNWHLEGVFYPLFKNNSYEAKLECAKSLIALYNKCKNTNKLNEIYKYAATKPYIELNDAEGLAKEFLKCKTKKQLFDLGVMYMLRNNIKKF